MVDTLVRAVETTKKEGSRRNLLKILTAGNCDQDNSEDDSDRDDYEEARDYDEIDDCDSQQAAGAGPARPTPGAAPGSCL
ncbi:MAG TPA: hypothetical protein VJX94_15830 [Stellaceae bacterium]|nr:hypothetical protein [Stellaceae bacterium]